MENIFCRGNKSLRLVLYIIYRGLLEDGLAEQDILAEVMQQASSITKPLPVLKSFYSIRTKIFLLECLYFSILQDLKIHIFETES